MKTNTEGRLVIISGPSGAGKSTVVRSLIQECPLPLVLSVSATTRPPRPDERDGREYYFLSSQQFEELRRDGQFLECEEVFGRGHWYGTLRPQVTTGLKQGQWVILEIDVQGAMRVLEDKDLQPITIFLHPGGIEELEQRLRARGTETEEAITRRLEVSVGELALMHRYRHEVINDTVERATSEICEILKSYQERNACSKS
ncbi:Guanylate kinase [Rosistilla ulvae]|uniref:Guanylate kinase n=1 Tax=Rosistilla ulvae TaxID=1930277 RepID=A0A517LZZ0_9BACT|nr:guanylate kinase [Rosistilla ulvae]QDS88181.1 Guanylate kinase [Rosistilla ulvae]